MINPAEEYIEVTYAFTGDDYIKDVIPKRQWKEFRDAFENKRIFRINYSEIPYSSSPFNGGRLNEKYIDMSKVVWIGF